MSTAYPMTNQVRKMEETCEMAIALNPRVQVLAAGADYSAGDHRGTWKASVERANGMITGR